MSILRAKGKVGRHNVISKTSKQNVGSYYTTLPVKMVRALKIEKGDTLTFTIDNEREDVLIKKLKEEKDYSYLDRYRSTSRM